MKFKKFRMEFIYKVKDLLASCVFIVSVDLKDAYLHIPIREVPQKYLRFAIKGPGWFYALPWTAFGSSYFLQK